MADNYDRQTWANGQGGGTPLNATRLNHVEIGIDDIDNMLQEHGERIDSLESGTGAVGKYVGSTADRALVAPAAGVEFYDTTLVKPLWGTGSAWIYADGTSVSGAGAANAPTNFASEVQPDNSVVFTWSAPAGIDGDDTYKLYANDATSGVSGKTAMTTTSTTYSPSPATGTRTYWVTANVDGTESAASNTAQVVLPYGGGSGGGGGDTPAEILNINGEGTGAGGWWNLGIGFRPSDSEAGGTAKHIDITPAQIKNGYVREPYIYPNATNTAVKMRVFMDGGRTSTNTKYPRSEFRWYESNGTTRASFNAASGTNALESKVRVLHMPAIKKEISVAQLHDGSDDTLQMRVIGVSGGLFDISCNLKGGSTDGGTTHLLVHDYTLGTDIPYKIQVQSSRVKIWIVGALVLDQPFTGSGHYWKAGCYAQANNRDQANSASDYFEIEQFPFVLTQT